MLLSTNSLEPHDINDNVLWDQSQQFLCTGQIPKYIFRVELGKKSVWI